MKMSIHSCEYEDTESYEITEMFVNRRENALYAQAVVLKI